MLAEGKEIADGCRALQVSEQTYYRGIMDLEEVRLFLVGQALSPIQHPCRAEFRAKSRLSEAKWSYDKRRVGRSCVSGATPAAHRPTLVPERTVDDIVPVTPRLGAWTQHQPLRRLPSESPLAEFE